MIPSSNVHGLATIGGGVRSLWLALALVMILSLAPGQAGEWRTIHNDNQRSGFTAETVAGPFERKWFRDFHGEMIASRVEAIVAEGKCFVGTFAGQLHALNVADGSTAWTVNIGGAIGASALYEKGRVFIGADNGVLACLRADDGKELWRYQADGGIWLAPATDGERLYFGDRAGIFHAVSLETGKRLWTFPTGGMILTPASITREGDKVVFGSETMHIYCLSPEGRLLWKTRQLLHGASLRDHAPTLWQRLVLVQTNPADGFHEVMDRQGHVLKEVQRKISLREGEKVLLDKWNDYLVTPSPDRREAEQQGILEYLRTHPQEQTFYALRQEDGAEPWVAPIFYTAGLHNPPTAPTFDPTTGELFVLHRIALNTYLRGVRRYTAIGKLDPATGRIGWSWPEREAQETWYTMPLIGDETQALSLMGSVLLGTHQGSITALNRDSAKLTAIWSGRDTYGGIFGPGAVPGDFKSAANLAREGYLTGMPNEWHGPDRSIAAIAEGRIFWVVGSQVVCLAGPEIAKTESGGTKPPPLIRSEHPSVAGGNLVDVSIGGINSSIPRPEIAPEQLREFLKVPTSGEASGPVRDRLDRAVAEWCEAEEWAPLLVQLGISGFDRYFWRTGETIEIVSRALPYLSPPLRDRAKSRLKELVDGGAPLGNTRHSPDGLRREPYQLGLNLAAAARESPQYRAGIGDLAALWSYGEFAGDWEAVGKQLPQAGAIFAAFAGGQTDSGAGGREEERAHRRAETLNIGISGVLAYARLMQREDDAAEVERALQALAPLVAERVQHEQADTVLIRPVGTARDRLHQAMVPRYSEFSPEVGRMLQSLAPDALERNLRTLTRDLPIWYHAFGERLIGGENYISPPHLARGVFMGLANGRVTRADELSRYLDQPWGKADLYFIEKCTALLRAREPQQ